MASKLFYALKTKVITLKDLQMAGFIFAMGMFLLGMPSDGGGLGG